jgi:hypothetical protein
MDDWLISKYGTADHVSYKPRRILSYGFNSFYVKTEMLDQPSVTVIDRDGKVIDQRWTVPEEDDHKFPVWGNIQLTNAFTGKVGYPDK